MITARRDGIREGVISRDRSFLSGVCLFIIIITTVEIRHCNTFVMISVGHYTVLGFMTNFLQYKKPRSAVYCELDPATETRTSLVVPDLTVIPR